MVGFVGVFGFAKPSDGAAAARGETLGFGTGLAKGLWNLLL